MQGSDHTTSYLQAWLFCENQSLVSYLFLSREKLNYATEYQ